MCLAIKCSTFYLIFQVVITVCYGHFPGLYCTMVAIGLRTRSLGETMLELCVMNFCRVEETPSHPTLKSLCFPCVCACVCVPTLVIRLLPRTFPACVCECVHLAA